MFHVKHEGENQDILGGLMDTPLAREISENNNRLNRFKETRLPKPEKTRIFTISNQKGGVGKTTTAVNVAAALASKGLQVLVIDLDPQGNASTALNIEHREGTPSVYNVLLEGTPIADVVQISTEMPGLTCVPATIDLAGAELELVSVVARETRLKNAIDTYINTSITPPDYVFIDCPPSLGLLTVNSFVAATEVLIPIQCEYYALEGLSQLLKNINLIKQYLNPSLELSTILLTMYDSRTRLAAGVAEDVRTHFADITLDTVIPRSVKVSEAPSYSKTVITYDRSSPGAISYLEAAGEIATRGASNGR
jgi:chromosome partitioning protein